MTITRLFFSAALLLLISGPQYAAVLYVHASAAGNADGSSWLHAFTDLSDALSAAQYGDEVWVAAGVYFPTTGTDRDAMFTVPPGVKLRGGFTGVETSPDDRDLPNDLSVISGDIGAPGDSLDNSRTLLLLVNPDTANLIEGFLLTGAHADGPFDILYPASCGGAIFVDGSGAGNQAFFRIRYCRFYRNYARRFGAGICGKGDLMGYVLLDIADCAFEENEALHGAGAVVYNQEQSNPFGMPHRVRRCVFLGNRSGENGGGLYFFHNPGAGSSFLLEDCAFTGNRSPERITGVALGGLEPIDTMVVRNCAFTQNEGGALGIEARWTLFENCEVTGNFNNEPAPFDRIHVASISGTDWLEVRDSRFTDNFAAEGWVLRLSGGKGRMTDCTVSDNAVTGLIIYRADSLLVDRCFLQNNRSRVGGAVRAFGPSEVDFANCLFTGNEAERGPVIALTFGADGTYRFTNCTFAQNRSTVKGNIFYNQGSDNHLFFRNSIFNENLAVSGSHNPEALGLMENAKAHFDHCLFDVPDCTSLAVPDTFFLIDITVMPPDTVGVLTSTATVHCGAGLQFGSGAQWTDPAGGDYTLQSTSPAIDAGSNLPADSLGLAYDLAGGPRLVGGTIDLGAYEWYTFSAVIDEVMTVSCYGGSDGAVDFTVTGLPPVSYEWSNLTTGASGSGTTGLRAGEYTFTVTDANGNVAGLTVAISEPSPLLLPVSVSPISCTGDSDATIAVEPEGGVSPYAFEWSSGATESLLTGLGAGPYQLTVTDANGCNATVGVQLNDPAPLMASGEVTEVSCYGGTDGGLHVTPEGGTPPYDLFWDGGHMGSMLEGLSAGVYQLTLRDDNGCQSIFEYDVSEPDSLRLSYVLTPATTPDSEDGEVIVTETEGGTPPYSYTWSDGTSGPSLSGLAAGVYGLTLTDANGCSKSYVIDVEFLTGLETGEPFYEEARLFPNPTPAGGGAWLDRTGKTTGTLILRDARGRFLWRRELNGEESLLTAPTVPGLYLLEWHGADGRPVWKKRWLVH